MLNRHRSQNHLYEDEEFVMHCCCTSLFPGVIDRMTFSIRPRAQDTQSRDRMEEYNYFLQYRDEVPDEGKHEGELQRKYLNCEILENRISIKYDEI